MTPSVNSYQINNRTGGSQLRTPEINIVGTEPCACAARYAPVRMRSKVWPHPQIHTKYRESERDKPRSLHSQHHDRVPYDTIALNTVRAGPNQELQYYVTQPDPPQKPIIHNNGFIIPSGSGRVWRSGWTQSAHVLNPPVPVWWKPSTDYGAIKQCFISVTPLHMFMTNYEKLEVLWEIIGQYSH